MVNFTKFLYVELSHLRPTLDQLFSQLMGVAYRWKSLGEALLLDEGILNEIYTNNETDEGCLHDMLERYMVRSESNNIQDEIDGALRGINVEEGTEHGELHGLATFVA